jgi:hypothetical protein
MIQLMGFRYFGAESFDSFDSKMQPFENELRPRAAWGIRIFADFFFVFKSRMSFQDHLPLGKLKKSFKEIKFSDPTFRAVKIFLLNDA